MDPGRAGSMPIPRPSRAPSQRKAASDVEDPRAGRDMRHGLGHALRHTAALLAGSPPLGGGLSGATVSTRHRPWTDEQICGRSVRLQRSPSPWATLTGPPASERSEPKRRVSDNHVTTTRTDLESLSSAEARGALQARLNGAEPSLCEVSKYESRRLFRARWPRGPPP